MKKNYLLPLLFACLALVLNSCTGNDESDYEPVSPVVLDVTQVPYAKLSDYKFFVGEMKNLEPAYKVIPYKPASELFSDYAHKQRFVWMPSGVSATYDGDDNALVFPVGAVMIKTFFYPDVLPNHTKKIIETRILVKTTEEIHAGEGTPNSGWKFFDYIWNDEQTEAYLEPSGNGTFVPVTFVENGMTRSITYKTPANTECTTCHKINRNQTGEIVIPIGVKPQNLNNVYDYGTSQRNQLQKWQSVGYLDNTIPESVNSTVDWKDTSKPLALRARSYIDINCAHCHRDGGHCDYVAMRFNFSNPDDASFGICMTPLFNVGPEYDYVIHAGQFENSELGFRISSTEPAEMMPIIGRTIVHEEGVQLIRDWINSMQNTCP
ncbi:MAG: hypothetical protein EOO48_03940 [Flavobacterium sp.]|nr:MAG: hypothetical protein EOO48_03940 [Flavobacterium sp.]